MPDVKAVRRRLLRLEAVNGRHVFAHSTDAELDTLGNLVRFVLLPGRRHDTNGTTPSACRR